MNKIFFTILFSFFTFHSLGYCSFKTFYNLDGLRLQYRFEFWFTSKAAIATLKVKKIDNFNFVATLTGETTGAIGFFTSYRKDIMKSFCKFDNKLGRFIPQKFIKTIIIGKDLKESIYYFDYKKKVILKKRKKVFFEKIDDPDDPFAEKKIEKHYKYIIPLKKYPVDDYLTAALNFILKIYGDLSLKKHIEINIFPESNKKKRNRKIKVYYNGKENNMLKIFVDLNVDFISDKIKKAYGLINSNMIPERIIIPTGTIIGKIKVKRITNEK